MNEDANISQQFIVSGYNIETPGGGRFSPNNGWFGVTAQEPDVKFTKENKQVFISLNGVGAYVPYTEIYEVDGEQVKRVPQDVLALFQSKSIRYIGMYVDGNSVYENWSGVLPGADVLNLFM